MQDNIFSKGLDYFTQMARDKRTLLTEYTNDYNNKKLLSSKDN